MSTPEYALHCAVADYLRAVLPPEVLWFHIPNGEKRSKIAGARLKRMGVRPGVADLYLSWPSLGWDCHWTTRTLWIELKGNKGKRSDAQGEFAGRIAALNQPYIIARSLADVERILKEYGVPTRGKIAA